MRATTPKAVLAAPEPSLLDRATLTRSIFEARKRFHADREADPTRYVKLWKEDDVAEWGPARALTLILRTRGCTWDYQASCTMCGYFVDVLPKKLTSEDLVAQWARAEPEHAGEELLKVYTGGNFLDPHEVFPPALHEILRRAAPRFRKITVETRPEYIRPDVVRPLVEILEPHGSKLELAIGLESSSDVVCDEAINKGYGFEAFARGAGVAHECGARVKAYLLLKPPFLTEEEAVEDMVTSVRDAAPHSDVVSVNPTNVQSFTLVDRMYRRREYRPPWLWSILEVLARAKPLAGTRILKSDPVGGGSKRGAHNCGRCDERILPLLERYNATQDLAFVEAAQAVECVCKREYRAVRELEGLLGASHYTG
jgi:archaeosine synthase beta-subunit